jgi:hypothetical protein
MEPNASKKLDSLATLAWASIALNLLLIFLFVLFLLSKTAVELQEIPAFVDAMTVVRSLLASLPKIITWPVFALITIIFLGTSLTASHRISSLFSGFRSFKLFGAEVEFSSEGARQLSISSQDAFSQFRRQAHDEFARQVRNNELRAKLELLFAKVEQPSNDIIHACLSKADFRCTIHVADVLFEKTLYQLVDYYPRQRSGGAGRRFSIRYGIIGRSWRMRRHDGEGAASADADDLVERWGMTQEEAQRGTRHRPSYVCVILTDQFGVPTGILYMDSKEANAFGDKSAALNLASALAAKADKVGLRGALENVVKELRQYSTRVDVEE